MDRCGKAGKVGVGMVRIGEEWCGPAGRDRIGMVWNGAVWFGRAGVERRREEKNGADWQAWNRLDRMGLVGSGTAGKGYQNN